MSRKTLIAAFATVLLLVAAATWMLRQAEERPHSSAARELPPRSLPRAGNGETISKSRWDILTRDDLPRHQRLEIARRISASLGPDDAGTLFTALRHTPRSGGEEDWYVILNEIMEQMRRHGLGSDEYSAHLGDLAADPSMPEVVRDYAIQHLALWIAPGNPDQVPHEENPEHIAQSLLHITTAIQDPGLSGSSVPGTALLALADISLHLPQELLAPAWRSLESYLNGVFSGGSPAHLSTRISAIQAVARTRQQQYLPVVRAFASDETADASVRLSSIASLGFYASPADQPLLEEIASQNSRFKYAAQSALGRFVTNP